MNSVDTKYVYIAHPDYLHELCVELGPGTTTQGNLVFSDRSIQSVFAKDIWYDSKNVVFDSINQAAQILREAGLRWCANPVASIRRMTLIAEKLKYYPIKKYAFPLTEKIPPIGAFSLLDSNTLIYATHRWKPAPNGDYHFEEDKKNPPNRAYLKLWEALSLLKQPPKPQDSVIDLGASPGGWSYVMQSLGTHVVAVDKAPLDPRIAALPNVIARQESAFSLNPDQCSSIDWLICDIACYPERLYKLINCWIMSQKVKHIIATIKLQGTIDFNLIKQFQTIPNATVLHLFHNKHELTFFWNTPLRSLHEITLTTNIPI